MQMGRNGVRCDVRSRAVLVCRQLQLALASSLALVVTAVVLADELADAYKRGFVTPEHGPVYFRIRALSMALGFCGEYIGSRTGLQARHAASIQFASQLLRTGAHLAGCGWWTRLLVISIEDVTGAAMIGAINVIQEKEARRSPTLASILDRRARDQSNRTRPDACLDTVARSFHRRNRRRRAAGGDRRVRGSVI